MPAPLIAQLIITLGPAALELIEKLVEVWQKPTLTVDEVKSLCSVARKSYAQYRAEALATN